jgi:hypothetical protein
MLGGPITQFLPQAISFLVMILNASKHDTNFGMHV